MAPPRDSSTNRGAASADLLGTSFRSHYGSFLDPAPIVQQSIARDLAEEEEDDDDDEDAQSYHDSDSEFDSDDTVGGPLHVIHDLNASYRRPSFVATGPRLFVLPGQLLPENVHLTKDERTRIRDEERSLLRDNQIIPPKHPRNIRSVENLGERLRKKMSMPTLRGKMSIPDLARVHEEEEYSPTEETALLGRDPSAPYGGEASPKNIAKKWEEAVSAGVIQTTWQREAKVLGRYSAPLILTFILQYSLTMTSIFTVGHIGKAELGAVSLASMTANITGYAVYQGLATSLDTLCAQAFGSGKKHLVGLQLQRMVYFLWAITIPIAVIWLSAERILSAIVPEKEIAHLAGLYLRVLLIGAPGYAAFESGKRYVQAQGLFSANLYVLMFCAPLNVFLNWLFVWQLGWGFVGAPIAVAIIDCILPLALFAYVYFIDGRECWNGFEKRALRNWWPMIKLSIPGLIMVLAEWLAFEILTLASSWISGSHLAAQSVLSTITALTYQLPFPVSIAASTRIANLIGATLAQPAKTSARVAFIASIFIGIFNVILLSSLRKSIPRLFTNDEEVIQLVSSILPLCASFQFIDALAAACNGILRGLGRQEIGGYTNLFAYYVIAMPISFSTAFALKWDLFGLWAGPAIALFFVFGIEAFFIYNTSWEAAVDAATLRIQEG